MALSAIGVVSKDNKPLAIRTKYDYAVDDEGKNDAERLKIMHLMHCSLDFVEEKQNTGHRDAYLGQLCHLETYKIYGLVTTTKTKILLLLSTQSATVFRDNDIRSILKNIHSIYTETTTSNPFHVTGRPIQSKAFDSRIKSFLVPAAHPY